MPLNIPVYILMTIVKIGRRYVEMVMFILKKYNTSQIITLLGNVEVYCAMKITNIIYI